MKNPGFFVATAVLTLLSIWALMGEASAVRRGLQGPDAREFPSGFARADEESAGSPSTVMDGRLSQGAGIVLARNIFESGEVGVLGSEETVEAEAMSAGFGPCAGGDLEVLTAVQAENRRESFAMFAGADLAEKSVCLNEGDRLGGYTVRDIGWRYTVLQDDENQSCYLDLYGSRDSLYPAGGTPLREKGARARGTGDRR